MLYFIDAIGETLVICANERGRREAFPAALFPARIEVDMPVIRWKDGTFTRYNGPFADEEGRWWQIVSYPDELRLESRRAPLSDEEIKEFLQSLAEEGSRSLLPGLDMLITDLLQDGRTELAELLIRHRETLT